MITFIPQLGLLVALGNVVYKNKSIQTNLTVSKATASQLSNNAVQLSLLFKLVK